MVTGIGVPHSESIAMGQPSMPSRLGYWRSALRNLCRDPITIICTAVLIVLFGCALLAPWLGLPDPYQTDMLHRLRPIGTQGHLFGTDELGRDMLSRLVYGGRLSLLMGIVPVFVATIVGATLGVISGYMGGRINMMIMRTTDVFYAFPSILLAVGVAGALGPGIINTLVAITVVFIPLITRVAESTTTPVRKLDFVEAARVSGANTFAILRVHVVPNVMGPVFVYATSLVSLSIIMASGLSFIGLGAIPPQAEWGSMLNSLKQSIYLAPLVSILPGILIFVASVCFNLISDSFRSAMDIRI